MAAVQSEHQPSRMEFPFATAPDILRAYQKDGYITGELSSQASSIIRALLGVRFAHKYAGATSHLTDLLYLCLTTLLGNRTLGEEYCDVVQIENDTLRLASLGRRLGFICNVVFAPWILSKSLPALRRKLRSKLESNIARAQQKPKSAAQAPRSLKLQEYILQHLDSLTSLNPIYALSLAIFYFTGSYYHLSKRLFGLRYIFTRKLSPNEQREGYEVLGVLLVLQMAVQSALHLRETISFNNNATSTNTDTDTNTQSTSHSDSITQPNTAILSGGVEVPLQPKSHHPEEGAPAGGGAFDSGTILADLDVPSYLPPGLAKHTSTPILDGPRYDLSDPEVMAWIPEGQQRKCTLCLEPFRDPSVTTCGHVFCWACVQDWVKEKAECPLCRQAVLPQKVLPLR